MRRNKMAKVNIYSCIPGKEMMILPIVNGVLWIGVCVAICLNEKPTFWALLLMVVFMIAVYLIAWLGVPRSVIVDDMGVGVRRTVKSIFIPMAEVTGVRRVTFKEAFNRSDDGAGGMFSITGSQRSRALGRFNIYVRNVKEMVLVECTSGKYVISAEDGDRLVDDIRSRMKLGKNV